MSQSFIQHPASYRDPSGFIFTHNGKLLRQVNLSFKEDYDQFVGTGCYDHMVRKGWLIPHRESKENLTGSANCYKTLTPEFVPFISYPSEWSFDMLKDAALVTLSLAKESLGFNVMLKDATPYNIQWHEGRMVCIDTLSFVQYREEPWIAYRQFCECFLAPLLVMHYRQQHLPGLFLAWPEGIPLAIARSLLPGRSRFALHVYLHIHLHAKIASRKKTGAQEPVKLSRSKLTRLLTSLEILIRNLKTPPANSPWTGYYEEAGLRADYLPQKKNIITNWLDQLASIRTAADLGANQGDFSKLLAEKNIFTVAVEADASCVNQLYLSTRKNNQRFIQPLVGDLANPTPATGFNNVEHSALTSRLHVDLVLALALVHHLAISKNIPLEDLIRFLAGLGNTLVIEFVPREDQKVVEMLANREDIYTHYNRQEFEVCLSRYFSLVERKDIPGSGRILYLAQKQYH
jgi:hypothetical protein